MLGVIANPGGEPGLILVVVAVRRPRLSRISLVLVTFRVQKSYVVGVATRRAAVNGADAERAVFVKGVGLGGSHRLLAYGGQLSKSRLARQTCREYLTRT